VITTLRKCFGTPVGYSGHEPGVFGSLAAVALGACVLERHITLDRTMWGSDQAASLEMDELRVLVRESRLLRAALGDGIKRLIPSEMPVLEKLRRVGRVRCAVA
jgi:N-acetylneuraminate synthase